jgi:hypothetical protein
MKVIREKITMTTERWTDEMLDKLAETVKENADAIRDLRQETKEQGIRFSAYQQASQWVVNLAFGLLATATITTIVSAVVRC